MGSFTQLTYHIVFGTKCRKPILRADLLEELYRYLGGVLREFSGSSLEIGGVDDHVHLLAHLSPTLAVADVVRSVKASSSKWLNDNHFKQREFAWQVGYGAFTVSYDRVSQIRRYIQNQEEHHRHVSFRDEYVDFLKRHGLEFREEHLFVDEHHG